MEELQNTAARFGVLVIAKTLLARVNPGQAQIDQELVDCGLVLETHSVSRQQTRAVRRDNAKGLVKKLKIDWQRIADDLGD